MRVVLVPALHIHDGRTVPYFPMGVLSLHHVLSEAGHDCTIYYPRVDANGPTELVAEMRRWAADILATKPNCVGLSTMCNSYPLVLLLARGVKHLSPQTPVVLGGPQASVVAEESMAAFPWLDYVVRGEAELAIVDLVQVIAGEKEPGEAASLTFRSNGRILSTPPSPLLHDLDSLPLPDYRAYPYYREALLFGRPPFEGGFVFIEPGRGCPHKCSFCFSSDYWRRRMRQKSPRLLAGQLRTLVQNHQVENVLMLQDIFTVDRDWLAEFLRAMEPGGEITWGCYLRADCVDAKTLAAMDRAGCRYVFFGVDSGSQQGQTKMRKGLDLLQARETIEAAVALGIGVSTTLIVGFPWETRQDLQDTLSLHQHFLSVGVKRARISLLTPFSKTEITRRYASKLRLDDTTSAMSKAMDGFWNAEMGRMIRRHPQIFSSFYYLEPDYVSYDEFRLAAWAGNALSGFTKGGADDRSPRSIAARD